MVVGGVFRCLCVVVCFVLCFLFPSKAIPCYLLFLTVWSSQEQNGLICYSDTSENLHGSVTVAYGIVIMFNFVDSVFAGKQIHLFIFKVYFPQYMLLKELYPARTEPLTAKAYDINVLLCCCNDQCMFESVLSCQPCCFAACVDLDVSDVSNKLLNPECFLVGNKKDSLSSCYEN